MTDTGRGDGRGIVGRCQLDEAALLLLHDGGVCNRRLIIDVLTLLSGLSRDEVSFNVELILPPINHQKNMALVDPFV